eukprot:scaffold22804_cov74-Phaeocystis_antarctica.AAC.9
MLEVRPPRAQRGLAVHDVVASVEHGARRRFRAGGPRLSVAHLAYKRTEVKPDAEVRREVAVQACLGSQQPLRCIDYLGIGRHPLPQLEERLKVRVKKGVIRIEHRHPRAARVLHCGVLVGKRPELPLVGDDLQLGRFGWAQCARSRPRGQLTRVGRAVICHDHIGHARLAQADWQHPLQCRQRRQQEQRARGWRHSDLKPCAARARGAARGASHVHPLLARRVRPLELPVRGEVRVAQPAVPAVGIPFDAVDAGHDADNELSVSCRDTPRARYCNQVAPRVERVTVPPKPGVLNAGKRDDRAKRRQLALLAPLPEFRGCIRRQLWVVCRDSTVLERGDVRRARREARGLNPRVLRADNEHGAAA